jgi:hypothetical protein
MTGALEKFYLDQHFLYFTPETLARACRRAGLETTAVEAETKGRANLVGWIRDRHPLCRHITQRQVDGLIASKMVTAEQVRAAGLRP